MNPIQIHLGLNHLPFVMVFIGSFLLAGALWKRSKDLKNGALLILFFAAILCIQVYFSGKASEEVAEHLPGVSEAAIEEHEQAALFTFFFTEFLGALAVAGWWSERRKRPLPAAAWWAIVIVGFFNTAVFLRTAHLGGLIRHPEIGSSAHSS